MEGAGAARVPGSGRVALTAGIPPCPMPTIRNRPMPEGIGRGASATD